MSVTELSASLIPGRSCPLSYRTRPAEVAAAEEIACQVAYVAGGLYGNPLALDVLERTLVAERERGLDAVLIFNGDFHWFDCEPELMASVGERVRRHHAIAGNVEIELATPTSGHGCGCGYPASIADDFVARSNRIMADLNEVADTLPAERQALSALPYALRLKVGDVAVGVIHGDPDSVAGWGLSLESWQDLGPEEFARRLERWTAAAEVDLFACTHTCTPLAAVFTQLGCAMINNGAAGMPNFVAQPSGLVTRISAPAAPADPAALYSARLKDVSIEAVPVLYDHRRWQQLFARLWPPGSPAAVSYRTRIAGQMGQHRADCYPSAA